MDEVSHQEIEHLHSGIVESASHSFACDFLRPFFPIMTAYY